MTIEEIKETVVSRLRKVAPEVDFDQLPLDEPLREELDIDSMDWLTFLIDLNEQTGVEIPESDYSQLDTLDHLLNYIYHAKSRK